MKNLEEQVKRLNELIILGDTIKGMELFYADEVEMQENEEEPRVGKQICIDWELRNLQTVKEIRARLLNQAIDVQKNIVFSEWEFSYITLNGEQFNLKEVSVQNWSEGKVLKEKFYYKGFH